MVTVEERVNTWREENDSVWPGNLIELVQAAVDDARAEWAEERAAMLKTYRDAHHWLKCGDIERALIVLDAEFVSQKRLTKVEQS